MAASKLPVMVDCDTGGDDAKSVVRMIHRYEAMGVSAIFIEDQRMPKRCGHMEGKKVVPIEVYQRKLTAAIEARHSEDFFIMARTDSYAIGGIKEAIKRGKAYLKTGADGLFIEGVETVEDLETIGKTFDVPWRPTCSKGRQDADRPPRRPEGDGVCDGPPDRLVFRVAQAIRTALASRCRGRLDLAGPIVRLRRLRADDRPAQVEGDRAGRGDVPDVGCGVRRAYPEKPAPGLPGGAVVR